MIYKRVFAVMKYSVVPHIMLCSAMLLGLLTQKGVPFRLEELFLGGFGVNALMVVANVFFADNGKKLAEKTEDKTPTLADYAFPLWYGFVGGIVVFMNYNVGLRANESIAYTMSFLGIAFVLMLYNLLDIDMTKISFITTNKTAPRIVLLSIFGALALVYTKCFGYAMLDFKSFLMGIMLPLSLFLLCETVKVVVALYKNKKEERVKRLDMFEQGKEEMQ